jgi:hypothetical protein
MIKSIIAISLSIALLSFQAGCVTRYSPYYLPPLSEEERERLGTIGIVSADFVPEPKLFTLSRGRVKGAVETTQRQEPKGKLFPVGKTAG